MGSRAAHEVWLGHLPPWVTKIRPTACASAGHGEPDSALHQGHNHPLDPASGSLPGSRVGLQVKIYSSKAPLSLTASALLRKE